MPERTQYTPGTFSWVDLATPDQDASKRFYGNLFGWEFEDNPVGEGAVYSMARLDGHYVSAISPQPAGQREAGMPPTWNSYVTVASADETLEQAQRCGGSISGPAFDVFDSGRMGVIQDPQGAYVMVWEPKNHIGAGLVNAPGALSWNELATPDLEESAKYYGRVFGWQTEPFDAMGMPYVTIATTTGNTNGGMRQAAASEPCYWLAYFGSENVEATLADVERHGGEVLMGPMDIGVGQLAAVQDPQGAVFALYGGHFDD